MRKDSRTSVDPQVVKMSELVSKGFDLPGNLNGSNYFEKFLDPWDILNIFWVVGVWVGFAIFFWEQIMGFIDDFSIFTFPKEFVDNFELSREFMLSGMFAN